MQNRLSTHQIFVLAFLALILLGTLSLVCPATVRADHDPRFLDALFTSTSAVCVTGLTVIDPGSTWNLAGQLVLVLLIQVGGLSPVAFFFFFFIKSGHQLGLKQEAQLKNILAQDNLRDTMGLLKLIFQLTLAVEVVGAILLFPFLYLELGDFFKAAWYSIFHSVSAFCNAGFSLFPDSLVRFRDNWLMLAVFMGLILAGGLGFFVFLDLRKTFAKVPFRSIFSRIQFLKVHTKLVLATSLILVLVGFLGILYFEREYPSTPGAQGVPTRLLSALFQSVSARTAGFNTIDIGHLKTSTLFLLIAFFVIGASPISTGGGIKTTTFALILLGCQAVLTRRATVQVFRRDIPGELIRIAFVIGFLYCLTLFIAVALLVHFEPAKEVLSLVFEAASAIGTVGLSTGVTPGLSDAGKWLVIFLMFLGRIGPLCLVFSLQVGDEEHTLQARLPEEKLILG